MESEPKIKKKWTESDEKLLRKLASKCKTREDIAQKMDRTEKSIERKADKLSILLPSKYQRHLRLDPSVQAPTQQL